MKLFVFIALIALAFATTKEDLNADAARLKKLAHDEIQKLEKEGKTVLAKEIKVIEDEIVKVEKHLETLHPNTEIGKLGMEAVKAILAGLEKKLDAEIKKLGGSFYDSTKDQLIKDANRLRALAQEEIKKLKAGGKHVLAAEISVLDKELHHMEEQLLKLHPSTDAGKVALEALESAIRKVEHKLEDKIKSLGGAFYDSTKDQLTADAAKLKKLAEEEIQKLEKEGKHALTDGIRVLEKDIITVQKHLETLHPETEMGKLALHAAETVLRGLEKKLEEQIKSLNGSFYDLKEELIKDASRLKELAADAIKKLKGEGKHVLAAEIQVIYNALHAAETQLEKLHPTTEAGQVALHALESVVKSLETKLQAKIKSLGN